MPNPAVPFPKVGQYSEFVIEGSTITEVSRDVARVATETEIEKEQEGWGYTNPNLHRRIVVRDLRDSARDDSEDTFTFYSNQVAIAQGQILTLLVQPAAIATITSCVYASQTLQVDVDYSVEYSDTPGTIYIQLLAGSSIIPAVSEENTRLSVNFRKSYPNDYTLEIQSVNSYRTTTKYTHDEDEAVGTNRTEIP